MENDTLLKVIIVSLQNFTNAELATLGLAVHLNGVVHKENVVYDKARLYSFIEENGVVKDLEAMRNACTIEVNSRVEAGTFN